MLKLTMFDKKIYIERRQKLKQSVGSGLILLTGNEDSSMNYKDNFYPFRQDSTFLYFFGIDRPGLMAVIDIDNNREILFGDDLTVEQMVWTGYQERLVVQSERVGILHAKNLAQLDAAINKARGQNQEIHFIPPYRPEHFQRMSALLDVLSGALPGMASINLIRSIVSQRSIKSNEEIIEIEKAVNCTIDMQLMAMGCAKEGMTEAMIAGRLHGIAVSAGGNLAFPTILTVNGQILHNHYSNTKLRSGEMVLCDCGAEMESHYAGDLTRTFPVDRTFSGMQKDIYTIVSNAHDAAAALLNPGKRYKDIHLTACEIMVEGLQKIGLMKGDAKEAVAEGAHAVFFPCGLGHMMGLDIHDMENLGEEYVGYDDEVTKSHQFGLRSLRLGKSLEQGFVLTVEPGIYFIPELIDQWAAEKKFTSFINYDKLNAYRKFGGIRVEEDYLITDNGCRLLGKQLPKEPDAIESFRI